MSFIDIYIQGFFVILMLMAILWIISIFIKNVSIVDIFWSIGFLLVGLFYFSKHRGADNKKDNFNNITRHLELTTFYLFRFEKLG